MNDIELALRACDGDELAFTRLCRRYGPMMGAAVRSYYAPGLTWDDLMQEARIGLHGACLAFDPSRGVAFSGLAATAVQRRVIDAVKTAQRGKHGPLNHSSALDEPHGPSGRTLAEHLPAPASDPALVIEGRDEFRRTVDALLAVMSPLEAVVLARVLNGASMEEAGAGLGRGHDAEKVADNALQRVRRKLRAALAA